MVNPPNSPQDTGPTEGDSLEGIVAKVRGCVLCRLHETRTNAVPGEGSDSPAIMFIGEGPGQTEDEQGRPFVGRAGRLLDELMAEVPLRREDVYITNVVKCRPPENRDPYPDEVTACWPYLEAQIALLQPRVIATLGRHSLQRFIPGARISQAHGQSLRWRNIVIFPLYHPAAALRSTGLRDTLAEDMAKLPEAVLYSLTLNAPPATAQEGTPTAAEADASHATDDESGRGPGAGGQTEPDAARESQQRLF
ncbi:MAG: uracil-DNA glycosylase family protein [Chloroflexota bacterium]